MGLGLEGEDSYEEALWEIRATCQRALEAARVLKSDMERLSQGMRDEPQTHSHSHSRSIVEVIAGLNPHSCSLERSPTSPSSSSQGRRVIFGEPEVELDPKGDEESYPPGPSIVDVETWLDWQACQLDTPCWWRELTAIPGVEDPWKLTQKIWASSIPEVRSRLFLGQDYTAPLPLNASPRMCSSQMNYPTRMCNNSLFS